MSFKETGRLTLRQFKKLYQHYKNDFDFELILKSSGKTYARIEAEQNKMEEWF
jgi:hypothetical protein